MHTAGVELVTELDTGLPRVDGDDQKLQQVFLNLIVNAEYAVQKVEVRRLTVRTRHDGLQLYVTVADTGIGMSPAVQAHVFEPFFTTKPAGVGTGLGLSVSYGIVQSHGGTIEVDSVPGSGTTFTITLPLVGTPAGDIATSSSFASGS